MLSDMCPPLSSPPTHLSPAATVLFGLSRAVDWGGGGQGEGRVSSRATPAEPGTAAGVGRLLYPTQAPWVFLTSPGAGLGKGILLTHTKVTFIFDY